MEIYCVNSMGILSLALHMPHWHLTRCPNQCNALGFYFCGVLQGTSTQCEISQLQNPVPHNCIVYIKYFLIGCDCMWSHCSVNMQNTCHLKLLDIVLVYVSTYVSYVRMLMFTGIS